jgi:hypothetical protein
MPVKPLQAPEIFQKPIASVDTAGLPPRGSPEFGEALIARIAMDYAGRGWNAVVTVDEEFVRVVAVLAHGILKDIVALVLFRCDLSVSKADLITRKGHGSQCG